MSQYQVNCPNCRQSFRASDEYSGASTQCQNCQSYFTVPTREQAVVLTPTIPQQSPQVSEVPKWYKTLTIMGPLCALLLLLGGSVIYWIINNDTKTVTTNTHDTEMIQNEIPPIAPKSEEKAKGILVVKPEKKVVEPKDENPVEWTDWWLRKNTLTKFRKKRSQGYLALEMQPDWKEDGSTPNARFLFMKTDEEDSSLSFAHWWGDKKFIINKHRPLIASTINF